MTEIPSPQAGGCAERSAFEAWYASHWARATGKTQEVSELAAIVVTMRKGDKYHDGYGNDTPYLNHLWEGWQARAAAPGAAAAAPEDRVFWPIHWPTMPPSRGQSPVLFEDGYTEGWAKCLAACQDAVEQAWPDAPGADAEDAARYRWLRDQANAMREDGPQVVITDWMGVPVTTLAWAYPQGEQLDVAIDAARTPQQGGDAHA